MLTLKKTWKWNPWSRSNTNRNQKCIKRYQYFPRNRNVKLHKKFSK